MSLKNAFTIIFGKLMVKTLHLLGRDAGNFPGLVLWTINKDCLKAFKVDTPMGRRGNMQRLSDLRLADDRRVDGQRTVRVAL